MVASCAILFQLLLSIRRITMIKPRLRGITICPSFQIDKCNGKAGCEAVRLINTLDAADGLLHIHTGSGALQGDVYMHLQYSWLCIIHGWVSGWSTRVS